MNFVDTHTHINLKEFGEDIDEAIARARNVGITKMCIPNVSVDSIGSVKKLCARYPGFLFPMMGIHPTSVNDNFIEDLELITRELEFCDYKAVGEIGMDLYWDKTFVEEQKEAFTYQVQLASRLSLPINVHIRNAFDETFEVLESINAASFNGIFHCFSGNLAQANKAISMGFLLSIGGMLTYKNSGLDKVVKELPLEKLVLETDAPWLTPDPHRSKRNEPAFLPLIAQKIADIHNTSIEHVAAVTTQNAQDLFRI